LLEQHHLLRHLKELLSHFVAEEANLLFQLLDLLALQLVALGLILLYFLV
jgi:hypothetical protein